MTEQTITEARHRLEVLVADTVTTEQREHRRITAPERSSTIIILAELHRLHLAVSTQAATISAIRRSAATRRKKP